MIRPIIEAAHTKLFASSELAALVGTNIHYAKAPMNANWPQVIFFEVATNTTHVVDFDKVILQFSMWTDKQSGQYAINNIYEIIYRLFNRFDGTITTYLGDVEITYTGLVNSGVLDESSSEVYGKFIRFEFRYRGQNLGGL